MILERKDDVIVILQLIREKESDLLEKWETGRPLLYRDDDSADGDKEE